MAKTSNESLVHLQQVQKLLLLTVPACQPLQHLVLCDQLLARKQRHNLSQRHFTALTCVTLRVRYTSTLAYNWHIWLGCYARGFLIDAQFLVLE